MNDREIANLLRSDKPLVVIEAPAGCGKTHQAASYAADAAARLESAKLLVLTHTHAACSVVADRTQEHKDKIDIRTLDSLTNKIATAYRLALDLPEDVSSWARQHGYEMLAKKVAMLLRVNPMISRHLAKLFPIIICDEHQDSNEAQDEIVQLLAERGSLLRVFGDPMQIIPGGRGQDSLALKAVNRWRALKKRAAFGELETPHRWKKENYKLGDWILGARESLKNNQPIDLSKRHLPPGVNILFAENESPTPTRYQLMPDNWRTLDRLLNEDKQMLLMAQSNSTAENLHASFRRRFPIWEGHTRNNLEKFIETLDEEKFDSDDRVLNFLKCVQSLTVGFSDSKYGKRLLQEVIDPSNKPKGKIPPQLNTMAKLIRAEPGHVGFSKAAEHLRDLIIQKADGFAGLHIDYRREFNDLISLKMHNNPLVGFAEISRRRSRTYPKPPRKALSTIHKSKGLEAECVFIFACDGKHFPEKQTRRNLLYVALSRATKSVTIIVSRKDCSPLIEL